LPPGPPNVNKWGMWISSKGLESIRLRVDRLETHPGLTIPHVEVGAHERLSDVVRELGNDVDDLKLAVAEGIERVDRAERRIKGTVKRARNKLKEHGVVDEGLEAEESQLREDDGIGSDTAGLQPMRPQMVDSNPQASSIRGVTADALKRVRGI